MPLRSLHSGNAAPTLSLLLLLLAVPRGAGAAGGVAAAALESPLAVNAAGAQLLTPIKYMAMGRAVFYEVPQPPVRGVVAFFHGCAHDASDLWPRERCAECDGAPRFGCLLLSLVIAVTRCPRGRSAGCNCKGASNRLPRHRSACATTLPASPDRPPISTRSQLPGLPEEVAHTKQALARGYAIIAIDAADATTRCFGVHTDRDAVVAILRAWLAQQGLQVRILMVVWRALGMAQRGLHTGRTQAHTLLVRRAHA